MNESVVRVSRAQRQQETREAIRQGASLTLTYAVMNMLATVIACYGLLVDSTAGIIGAMVVALLLGPIAGVGLALVDSDTHLLRRSLLAGVVGIAIVMATAFVIGFLHRDIPISQEMLARTRPGSFDLAIALAGGVAATIATISRGVNLSLVGVAIATALVPPLSTCSMLLARGDTHLAGGAFLLAFTNIVAIQFASSVVFWVAGFSNTTRLWAAGYRALLRNSASIVLLCALAVLLGVSTHRSVQIQLFETKVRETLQLNLDRYPGARLSEVRFENAKGHTLVRAVVRSPTRFSAMDVTALERALPSPPDGTAVSLRVRRIGVEEMTPSGPVFETADSAVRRQDSTDLPASSEPNDPTPR
jgi:uncharacterized hydrophobic protein (TIGR00271 family)